MKKLYVRVFEIKRVPHLDYFRQDENALDFAAAGRSRYEKISSVEKAIMLKCNEISKVKSKMMIFFTNVIQ
ncbi:MAG: hypothetical protein GX119_04870 [Syntrophomonadaceae bacterium]|jgi:hypothetical protein|nr:hypothetical protein [Syntrophomonadaceae bacterium]